MKRADAQPDEKRRGMELTQAQRIKAYIDERCAAEGITGGAWATMHGITPSNLSNWGSGKTPRLELAMIEKVADALGVDVLDVLSIAGYDKLGKTRTVPRPVAPDIDVAIDADTTIDPDGKRALRAMVKALRETGQGGRVRTGRRASVDIPRKRT